MTYTITRPVETPSADPQAPPAVITIRVQKVQGGAWQPCPLLAIRAGWVQVDDGLGPLWVMVGHLHPRDWPKLTLFEGLQGRQN